MADPRVLTPEQIAQAHALLNGETQLTSMRELPEVVGAFVEGLAIAIEEYVPKPIPTKSAKANENVEAPPYKVIARRVMSTVREVEMLRPRVSFKERFTGAKQA